MGKAFIYPWEGHMSISLKTFIKLNKAKTALRTALDQFEHEIDMAFFEKNHDADDVAFLRALSSLVADFAANLGMHCTNPQSEWPGGPSTGKDALPTKLRRPKSGGKHPCVHFTQQEIEEAVAAGVLKGHYGGPYWRSANPQNTPPEGGEHISPEHGAAARRDGGPAAAPERTIDDDQSRTD